MYRSLSAFTDNVMTTKPNLGNPHVVNTKVVSLQHTILHLGPLSSLYK